MLFQSRRPPTGGGSATITVRTGATSVPGSQGTGERRQSPDRRQDVTQNVTFQVTKNVTVTRNVTSGQAASMHRREDRNQGRDGARVPLLRARVRQVAPGGEGPSGPARFRGTQPIGNATEQTASVRTLLACSGKAEHQFRVEDAAWKHRPSNRPSISPPEHATRKRNARSVSARGEGGPPRGAGK